jgi:hypothetical protein
LYLLTAVRWQEYLQQPFEVSQRLPVLAGLAGLPLVQ